MFKNSFFTLLLTIASSSALEIELRYDLDDSGFFDNAEARAAMRAVADVYEDLIVDELEAIDAGSFPRPSGVPQRTWQPFYLEPKANFARRDIPGGRNMVVPADTLIIYPAGREISSAGLAGVGGAEPTSSDFPPFDWWNQVYGRNEPGALRYDGKNFNEPSDIGSWGGVVFFNQNLEWNFSTTDPNAPGEPFIAVALHELAHVLGFGEVGSTLFAWQNLVDKRRFLGSLGFASNDGRRAGLTSPHNHFFSGSEGHAENIVSKALPIFGNEHGEPQPPLMTAIIESQKKEGFLVLTDLDVASLQDLGWEITPEFFDLSPSIACLPNGVSETPDFEIGFHSTTGISYELLTGSLHDEMKRTGIILDGDGSRQSFLLKGDPSGSAFFQVDVVVEEKEPEAQASSRTFFTSELHTPPPGGKPASACLCCHSS